MSDCRGAYISSLYNIRNRGCWKEPVSSLKCTIRPIIIEIFAVQVFITLVVFFTHVHVIPSFKHLTLPYKKIYKFRLIIDMIIMIKVCPVESAYIFDTYYPHRQ